MQFLFRMVCNREMLYHHYFRICHQEGSRKWTGIGMGHISSWFMLMMLIYWVKT